MSSRDREAVTGSSFDVNGSVEFEWFRLCGSPEPFDQQEDNLLGRRLLVAAVESVHRLAPPDALTIGLAVERNLDLQLIDRGRA